MFNLLRMDLRRLFKTRSFYIVLAVTAGLLVLMIATISAVSDQEKLDALQDTGMVVTSGSSEDLQEQLRGMTRLDFVYECLGSGFLLVLACIGVTLFVNGDFSSGYIKNICFARPRRWEYILSKVLVGGVYSGAVTVLGVLVSLACPIPIGLHLTASPMAGILQYTFWLWLPNWAFSLLGLALVLLTRSSTLGIAMGILAGSGFVAVLVQNLCQKFGWHDFSQYMLGMVASYQCVPAPGTQQMIMILACTAGWGLAYALGSFVLMEKRDI